MSKARYLSGQAGEDKMAVDAYALPNKKQRSDDIVEVVCRIMDDDGPRPMKHCRPSQKNRNAADQFDEEHQEAYEKHARSSRDRVHAVHVHNAAYPKMYDELNRRRSTAKVTMMSAQRTRAHQQAIYNCCNDRIKKKKKAQRKKKISRYTKDTKKKTRQRQVGARITKPKSRQRVRRSPCRIYRVSKITTNIGCQCSMNDTPLALEAQQPLKMAEDTLTCRDLKGFTELKRQSKTSQCSKESSKLDNPDTDPSVSSYNTYASMEDEPMVSN